MKPAKVKLTLVTAGHWMTVDGGHTYNVFRTRTDYGDEQWVIDRDDRAAWAQCPNLRNVRSTILAARLRAKS